MFYIKMIIRNYWEIHGTFEGIENTVLNPIIIRLSEEAGKSQEDFLYEQLGYKPLAQFSAKEVFELRTLFVTRQYVKLQKKLKLKTNKEVQQFFKAAGISSISFDMENTKTMSKYDDIANLLAFYYKNDTNLYCIKDNKTLPFFYYLEKVSSRNIKPETLVNSLTQDKEVLRCLAKIQHKNDSPLIIQGKRCITSETYSKEEKVLIQQLALKKACFPYGVNLNRLFGISQNLVFMSFLDNEKYLKLLDFAHSQGITYQALAQSYNIKLADQLPVFSKYGVLLYKVVEGTSYVIDKDCDEKEQPYKEENLYFNETL